MCNKLIFAYFNIRNYKKHYNNYKFKNDEKISLERQIDS